MLKKTISGVLAVTTLLLGSLSTLGNASAYSVESKDTPAVSGVAAPEQSGDDEEQGMTAISSEAETKYGLRRKISEGAILHAWSWSFSEIEANMQLIAESGYSAVQTSPVSMCAGSGYDAKLMGDVNGEYGTLAAYSGLRGDQGAWWWVYQPISLKIGNVLGTEGQYKSMCKKAHEYGIKVITDIVSNHTAMDYTLVQDDMLKAVGIKTTAANTSDLDWLMLYHKTWNTPSKMSSDRKSLTYYNLEGKSSGTEINDRGLRDINTENPAYQKYLLETLMNKLLADGCDGFRFDTAKHIAVKNGSYDDDYIENGYAHTFWPRITGKEAVKDADNNEIAWFNKEKDQSGNWQTIRSDITPFIYGEILDGSDMTSAAYGAYDDYMAITASNYGYTLRNNIKSDNLTASNLQNIIVGSSSNLNATALENGVITWIESHDTYCNDHDDKNKTSARMTDWQLRMGWAIIAARGDGTPLFFNRPYGSAGSEKYYWGQNTLGNRGNDQFFDPEVSAVNHFRNAMIGQNMTMTNVGGDTKVLSINRGNVGVCIINDNDSNVSLTNKSTSLANGTYYDTVSGTVFKVSGGIYTSGSVKAKSIATIYNTVSVSASPESGSFTTETLSVTPTLANGTNGSYYVIVDGEKSDVQSFTTGTPITIGADVNVSGSSKEITLALQATDANNNTVTKYYNYIKRDSSDVTYVYYDKSVGWGNSVYAYVYYDAPDGTRMKNAAWPGVQMTDDSVSGYLRYEIPYDMKNGDVVLYSTDSNRYPADGAGGLALAGKSMVYSTGNSWTEYTSETEPAEVDNDVIPDTDTEFDNYRYVYFFNSVGWKTDGDNHISVTLTNNLGLTRTGNMTYSDTLHCYYYKYGLSHNYNSITFKGTNGSNTACTIQVPEPENGFAGRLFVPSTDSTGTWGNITDINEYKVYFNNSQSWSNVNVYLWKDGAAYKNAAWPGSAMASIGTVGSYTKVYSCTYYSTVQFDKVKFNNRPNSTGDQTGDTNYSAATTNTSIYTYSSKDVAGGVNNITTQKPVTVEIAYANEKAPTMTDTDTVTSENKTTQLADKASITNSDYSSVVKKACEDMSMTNVYDEYTFFSASQFDYIKALASQTDPYVNPTLPRAAYTNPASFAHPSTAFGGANITADDKLKRYNNPAENGEWVEFYKATTVGTTTTYSKVESDQVYPNLGNVDKIKVWAVSMPRTYTVNFDINGTVISETCSYNQLLSTTTQNNIKTAIENTGGTFDGWYIKVGGKELKISSEPDYKYRITQSRTLYARFRTTDRPAHKATAIADPIDVFSENGTTMYRYNTLLNICDLGDSDSNITQVGIVYVKPNDSYSVSTIGSDIQSHISSIGTYNPDGYTILKSAVYNVGDGTNNTVTLTTKNRLQFNLKLTQDQATNGNYSDILAYTVYTYNGTWHVSENCVHYNATYENGFTEIE